MKISNERVRLVLFLLVASIWTFFYFVLFDREDGVLYPLLYHNLLLFWLALFGYIAIGVLLAIYERKNIKRPFI